MTSASGGAPSFDWSSAVRPLLAATYGNIQPGDLIKLAKCIETSRDQIMKHEADFEPFYSLFVALATHHLCSNAISIPKTQLPTVISACRVLAEFILDRLQTSYIHCAVMPKQFVLLVKSFCKGNGFLQRSDIITLAALLKSSELPSHIRATIGVGKLSEEESLSKTRKKDRGSTSITQASPRAEAALTNAIDFLSVLPSDAIVERAKDSSKSTTPTDSSRDIKEQFINEMMQYLSQLNAGSVLIDVCLKLPFLARYNLMYRDMLRGEALFTNINVNDCQSVFDSYASVLNDVVMVSQVVILPLFEPLTPELVSKLCSLGCTCLLAACTVIIAYGTVSSKADNSMSVQEMETFTNSVVEKSLQIFSTSLSDIQISPNVDGTQLQNMRSLGAWCICVGLSYIQQHFDMNGATVCMAQHLLALLHPLFVDLQTDTGRVDTVDELNVNVVLTPWQRFVYIDNKSKQLPVLMAVAHDSFLKGVDMMRGRLLKISSSDIPTIRKCSDLEGENDSTRVQSIPNTPSESDSEPLLGSWLEELLCNVPQIVDSAVKQSAGILHSGIWRLTSATLDVSGGSAIKEDAHTYLMLSVNCLRTLNEDLLHESRPELAKKVMGSFWTEREVGFLATLIRTVDTRMDTTDVTEEALSEFKFVLSKFLHNLIANGMLGESLEACLLEKLGITSGTERVTEELPLNLSSCLCGVLCQILLLRQSKARDASGHNETGSVIVGIWRRVLKSLDVNASKPYDDINSKDVNMEHLQALLSLFHSLPLMQQKTVLLDVCKTLTEIMKQNGDFRNFREKRGETSTSIRILSEAVCTMLNDFNDLFMYLNHDQTEGPAITYDSDMSTAEQETDGLDDYTTQAEDDESGADDSDEESMDNKLCTFTVTQKEFMNQHWYHCHTCGMVDGEGVCTVCAKLCHKGHDLSYSKYGSFFCDCGARAEPMCQALVKRTKTKPVPKVPSQTALEKSTPEKGTVTRPLRRKGPVVVIEVDKQKPIEEHKRQQLYYGGNLDKEELRKELRKELAPIKNDLVKSILEFLEKLVPIVSSAAEAQSSIGNLAKLRKSARELKECADFRCDTVETLAILTGSSQENAFENVNAKLNFPQTIKQLLLNHVLHRTCLACASSQNKRRQFLTVVHDRCKVSIMQLSNFLKQIENGKKKPTLSRIISDSFPFMIFSIAENPLLEDYVAVCGLNECVVLTLSQAGTIADKLTLSLGLDVGNFVIKALWLPGSPTEMALVTADFVRIFDLAKNSVRPEYDFLLPAGKIRDATFVCRDTMVNGEHVIERYLLLMTSSGHVYVQNLGEHCHNALHGSFYVTDVLEIRHNDLEESGGNIGGGGMSIYYLHNLELLFLSYCSGKNLFCSFNRSSSGIGTVGKINPIFWKSNQKSVAPQALYRWSELQGHGGVVVALTHATQSPVVLFIRPKSVLVQEIALSQKTKILDVAACRSVGGVDESASYMLLLCDDGTVRTVNINRELTNAWLKKPSTFRLRTYPTAHRLRGKRTWKPNVSATTEFPVDFFEQCQQLMEVEFGGSDLLQVYNVLQLRTRLQTTNLYIVSAKIGGFQLEILNREEGMVICGVRVEIGKHSVEKSPSYIEIFGRRRPLSITHGRWIDMPFSKDESVSTGNKVIITFGPTTDASGVCIVDSVKVYGKTKDAFGWPDDIEEDFVPATSTSESRAIIGQISSVTSDDQPQLVPQVPATSTPGRNISDYERMVKIAFETLAVIFSGFSDLEAFTGPSIGLATSMLVTTAHSVTIRSAKLILRSLSSSKSGYYINKDSFILKYTLNNLKSAVDTLDPELFSFLVSLARNVVINRPQSLKRDLEIDNNWLTLLPDCFWRLRANVPRFPAISPIGNVEISDMDGLVHAIVDILHAHCVTGVSWTGTVVKLLTKFLICEDLTIAVACRNAVSYLYRPKQKKKRDVPFLQPKSTDPKSPGTQTGQRPARSKRGPQRQVQQQALNVALMGEEQLEQFPDDALLIEDGVDAEGIDQVYDIHAEGDDDAMMELAIALSLQDQANEN